ncbi:hypothetical protein BOTCAL_0866g00010 [Botryotinia calthae]|uniref:Uncharacterized protein n=1 Tax=Botryotinia calthae TaxID=38488 RepID=A0A4Y8CFD2_9HELO|nr:hypothetical protein BOTCAL_0866g00010 [Botryotinia calthae]
MHALVALVTRTYPGQSLARNVDGLKTGRVVNDWKERREGYGRRERREKSDFVGLLLMHVEVRVTVRVGFDIGIGIGIGIGFGADVVVVVVVSVGDLLIKFADWWLNEEGW